MNTIQKAPAAGTILATFTMIALEFESFAQMGVTSGFELQKPEKDDSPTSD